ncbi:MAG: thymidine kinase [Candidatus Eisenbacteria bacterium]|uniref:Thymidine kinase n=1 Tax=Eiseniibacteriota bacterium TaxID=2212470 RepID=A0A849SJ51_UNCEI|nr:thymidine kinase [Candidatus Eisenbacteria bacterium]
MSQPAPPLPNAGWIEVIVGSMYSGKTEELIRRLRRAQIARQRVEIFKPAIDRRYADDAIVSHSEVRIPSRTVRTAADILRHADQAQVIGIDEGQFLGRELVAVCQKLAKRGKRVIVAGLDQDYQGRPFEPMPELLAVSEYITKTLAICVVCGEPANRTYRKVRRAGRVVVGGSETYEARCRRCWELGRKVQAPELAPPPGGTHAAPTPRPRRAARAARGTRSRRLRA